MSQHPARPDPRARSADDADVATPRPGQPGPQQRPRPGRPGGDDGGTSPDGPDEHEFEVTGDDDLSPGDLGPLAPDPSDPDDDSGRIRKIS
jgi:hypothetical protein